MAESSWLGSVVLYHLPFSPLLILSEASPMHLHSWLRPPFESFCLELRRPQRHALVSMNSGRLNGEAHFPSTMQGLLGFDIARYGGTGTGQR